MKVATFLNERREPPKAWRLLGLLTAFFALTTFVPPGPQPERTATASQGWLIATPVSLNPGNPEQRRVGGLIFRRGWTLTSDVPRFGGISGMHVEDGQVTAISDSGDLLLFPLPGEGPLPVHVVPLALPRGSPDYKYNRDTEALAIHGDQAWVAFEQHNMVARYRRADWRLEAFERPRAIRRWPFNSGPESLVRLPDGRFLTIAEDDGATEFTRAVLFDGDPTHAGTAALSVRYRRPAGHRPTDAAMLPDGRLLILNRRAGLTGMSAVLTIADMPEWRQGATIEGRELARLSAPLSVDNMEALSVTREEGRTIVRIASDDNFMGFQRNLLLEFELAE